MSQSLASAKKRRAQNESVRTTSTPQFTEQTMNTQSSHGGLTLPQVIKLVDHRLIVLEKFMNQSISSSSHETQNNLETINEYDNESKSQTQIKEIVEEFDKRYELLAEEIVNLKNIVLNLQSYTMEVNKTLYDERKINENIVR